MVNKCIKRRLISLVTGKYKLKQYCREFWPYLSTVIKGNNLIFIESLFCVRRCADSSLNINSALNLYRNLENQKQTVFLFTIENSSSERLVTCLEFTQLLRAEQGSDPGFLPLPTLVFLGFGPGAILCLNTVLWGNCEPQANREEWNSKNKQKT